VTKKKPRGATRGESSNQYSYQERTEPVNTTETITRKSEPLPPSFTTALLEAFDAERNSDRSVAEIILQVAAEYEAGQPTC
jgi:hypothetical protein